MKKSVRITIHACFWLLIPLSIAFYDWAGQADNFFGMASHSKSFLEILLRNFQSVFVRPDVGSDLLSHFNILGIVFNVFFDLIYPLVVFYLFYGYFSPRLVKQKTYSKYILPGLFILVVPFGLVALLSTFIFSVDLGFYSTLSLAYVFTLFFSVSGFFFFLLEYWFRTEKLARQNLQSELALLKNQVNPHFLFNTLNNIDSLIKKNAGKASETLLKLSDILRYMIYDTNAEKVQLSSEIMHIESYIELQKLQFANRELVSFSVEGDPGKISIAPMLFIPFVENAFKHCTDKCNPGAIRFTFTIQGGQVLFVAVNQFEKSKIINKDYASGVGLNNVKRRLEIIYPGLHTLSIKEESSTFIVTLSVITREH
ncbi:MAG: sensor histidine kinase [Bacteroidetes bacterium]|nr:sensor histidine kinase [Bacteroidota bacterium]